MLGNYPDGVREGDPNAPWNHTDPDRTCGNCLFCKEVVRTLGCVVEVFDAEDEDELYDAEVHAVDSTQEACDQWVDAEK